MEMTLTLLWQTTDTADAIVQFLPTKSLSVLPTVARIFRRDQPRQLAVLLRRHGVAATGTSALLSTLQLARRGCVLL